MRLRKRLGRILFIAYCFVILWFTILSRTPANSRVDLRFMWAYREMLTGHPDWKKDVIQNIQNILFFVPFGILFPGKKWKDILFVAASFSLIIEFVQYIGGFGLCELDDVICNTLGAVIGNFAWIEVRKKIGRNTNTT